MVNGAVLLLMATGWVLVTLSAIVYSHKAGD